MAIRHYVLLATDGFIQLPNDATLCTSNTEPIYVWGFKGGLLEVDRKTIEENKYLDWREQDNLQTLIDMKGNATIPSPLIWADVGDDLYITLINLGMEHRPDLTDFHTVHLHGAHVATQLDGFPETSFGVPMWMGERDDDNNLVPPPVATYYFKPENPGTLMYHCHVEASEHVQMGMYGALVIYPSVESLCNAGIVQDEWGNWYYNEEYQCQIPKEATHRNFAYNDINTYFDKEYVMLLSDIDSKWHKRVRKNLGFNAVNFKPNYWLVNGRAFPDTLLPHHLTAKTNSNPNLTQINYESYVHVKTGDEFLLRMINLGYQVVPWHIHGWHFSIIGKDSHISPFLELSSMLKHTKMHHNLVERGFTATIGSGETYDLLITADNKLPLYGNYILKGQDCFKSLCEQLKDINGIDEEAIFAIPTEPVDFDCSDLHTVDYVSICNQTCYDVNKRFFPQFYPMHNHDDYKVTNNGTYPGGQLTYIQTDAPMDCCGCDNMDCCDRDNMRDTYNKIQNNKMKKSEKDN